MTTVDFMAGFGCVDEQAAIGEAAAAGLRGVEHLIRQLSRAGTSDTAPVQMDCRQVTDHTVSKFRKVISMLGRTGHARFRRGPVGPDVAQRRVEAGGSNESFSVSAASSSFLSSVTGDGSVSNGRWGGGSSSLMPPPAGDSAGNPLSSASAPAGQKRKCHRHAHSENGGGGKHAGRCHCSKSRKSRVRTTIRVPAISSKNADIPPDEFSWRKYGQKPIKGSPYPRGYYKCSTVRGCPARKHVERALDDPTMLIVTYEGDHRHTPAPAHEPLAGAGALGRKV